MPLGCVSRTTIFPVAAQRFTCVMDLLEPSILPNPGNSCEYAGESELHLRMKQQIYENLQELIGKRAKILELEKALDGCRPDIYIEGKQTKTAIEVQTSALTPEAILYRTSRYYSKGIYVLWVVPYDQEHYTKFNEKLGTRTLVAFRVKEYERIMLYCYYKNLIAWDVKKL